MLIQHPGSFAMTTDQSTPFRRHCTTGLHQERQGCKDLSSAQEGATETPKALLCVFSDKLDSSPASALKTRPALRLVTGPPPPMSSPYPNPGPVLFQEQGCLAGPVPLSMAEMKGKDRLATPVTCDTDPAVSQHRWAVAMTPAAPLPTGGTAGRGPWEPRNRYAHRLGTRRSPAKEEVSEVGTMLPQGKCSSRHLVLCLPQEQSYRCKQLRLRGQGCPRANTGLKARPGALRA